MSKTCCTREGSISVTRQFGFGGIGLVRFLLLRSAGNASRRCVPIPIWQWHLDEVFVKINGETHYLWRAVDHEGEVLESYVTKRRDRKAALKFLRKTMKRYGSPHVIVTDKLRSYGAAMKVIGNAERQETGRWKNNRSEDSHPLPGSGLFANHEKGPFRRRERAMQRFRSMRSLQKFASVHSSVHNHFNLERHLYSRANFKLNRAVALAEWRQLDAP
ncbi:MAG: putative transposase [Paracoccaceae bacterium]|jgi:putative transposase